MKARVESELCVACGACVEICPQVFSLGGWGAVARGGVVPADLRKSCLRAAEECWTGAILLDEPAELVPAVRHEVSGAVA